MLDDNSEQREFWKNEFGNDYIKRNNSLVDVDIFYKKTTGHTKSEIFQNFFSFIEKDLKILELGCNIGINLEILKKIGFKNLYGLEINKKAIEIAKNRQPDIQFFNGSIEEFDFHDQKFDLVYTAGVLIHINPNSVEEIIKKIISLTNKYIFGFEYFSDDLVEIQYRDNANYCWKQNFPLLFKRLDSKLITVKEEKIPHLSENQQDIVYMFKK